MELLFICTQYLLYRFEDRLTYFKVLDWHTGEYTHKAVIIFYFTKFVIRMWLYLFGDGRNIMTENQPSLVVKKFYVVRFLS